MGGQRKKVWGRQCGERGKGLALEEKNVNFQDHSSDAVFKRKYEHMVNLKETFQKKHLNRFNASHPRITALREQR